MWGMWLFLGFYLYQIKMLSVGQVWTHWFRVWRCKDEGRLDSRALVDTEVMNEALFSAFVFETIPHLVLQAASHTATQGLPANEGKLKPVSTAQRSPAYTLRVKTLRTSTSSPQSSMGKPFALIKTRP